MDQKNCKTSKILNLFRGKVTKLQKQEEGKYKT